MTTRHAGRLLVDQLRLNGVERCFGVPGESFLPVLDAFHDAPAPSFITCRHEGGAAMMAEADGKLTGRPGVAFVTRGPGACNAAAGVHVAQQDSTPLILFVGQVERAALGRDAFQEVDYRAMFSGMAKWVVQVEDAAALPGIVHRALATAASGRPGPVVVALPEDVLHQRGPWPDGAPWQRVDPAPDPEAMARLGGLLANAERPLVVLGGGGWTGPALASLAATLRAWELPTACGFRRQDLLDTLHPSFQGDLGIAPNPDLVASVQAADLLVVVGARLGEMTTQGYTLLGLPRPKQMLVHVHQDPAELGRVYQPDLPIAASLPGFVAALATLPIPRHRPWAAATAAGHGSYLAWRDPPASPGPLQLGEIVAWLRQRLPADAVVTNGAGNYCGWVNRGTAYRGFRTQLAPTSGSMGYGLPAAIAAKLHGPSRTVVAFAGDGCFMMTGMELATAVQYGLAVTVIVIDNGMYGTIRMHQEREFPGREAGTHLVNPDFAALARAHGAFGATVTETAAFAPAFAAALDAGGPALLHLKLAPEAITPRASLSAIRLAAVAAGR